MNWTILAAILSGANGIVVGVIPAGSKWGPVVTAAIGLLATVAAKLAPAGTQMRPTPDLTVDDTGPALGKASGEAGSAASKGPFLKA